MEAKQPRAVGLHQPQPASARRTHDAGGHQRAARRRRRLLVRRLQQRGRNVQGV